MPKKVLVALPPAMLEQIDFVAGHEHRTRSDLIREALRRYLETFRRCNSTISKTATQLNQEHLERMKEENAKASHNPIVPLPTLFAEQDDCGRLRNVQPTAPAPKPAEPVKGFGDWQTTEAPSAGPVQSYPFGI